MNKQGKVWIVVTIVGLLVLGSWLIYKNAHDKPVSSQSLIRFRLQWTPQAQFAGYLVAKELGYYDQEGINVEIRPAGPDLKPQNTIAAGSDDIAVGVSNQIIAARSNGVPLKIIAQIYQDSANRYILKKNNSISSLKDLRGKKVGLWLGGDEAEFVAMLKTAGMTLDDIVVVPEGFTIAPFLHDEYVLSQVTVYNELNQIRDAGFADDKLQILSPRDYDAAILGDMLFSSEKYLRENPLAVQKFLAASLRGWKFCVENPEKAVDIVLTFDKSLKRADQAMQLKEVLRLILSGTASTKGIGNMEPSQYEIAERVLFDSKQIFRRVDSKSVFDDSFWNNVQASDKLPRIKGPTS